MLVVSELVTNAIRHAGTPFDVSVDYDGRRMRIAVADRSDTAPHMVDSTDTRLGGGLGLRIVQDASRRWGWGPSPTGKVVWAELDCHDG
jgi:anti-sigma regulatory factor (Ser/Thr protein kinase)